MEVINPQKRSSSMPGNSDEFDCALHDHYRTRNTPYYMCGYRSLEKVRPPDDYTSRLGRQLARAPRSPRRPFKRTSSRPRMPSDDSGHPRNPIGGSDDDPITSESEPEYEPESELESEPEPESADGDKRSEGKRSDSWSEIPAAITTRGRLSLLHVPLLSHSLSAPSSPTFGPRRDLRWSPHSPLSLSPPRYPDSVSRSPSRGIPELPIFRFGPGEESESDGNDSESTNQFSDRPLNNFYLSVLYLFC